MLPSRPGLLCCSQSAYAYCVPSLPFVGATFDAAARYKGVNPGGRQRGVIKLQPIGCPLAHRLTQVCQTLIVVSLQRLFLGWAACEVSLFLLSVLRPLNEFQDCALRVSLVFAPVPRVAFMSPGDSTHGLRKPLGDGSFMYRPLFLSCHAVAPIPACLPSHLI